MSDRLTHILLIDDDSIFRLGLRTALEAFPDLQIVAQADTGVTALNILSESENAIDLVILELSIGRNPNQSGLTLCQRLKTNYPYLPYIIAHCRIRTILAHGSQSIRC
jgi:DNA-binding NarL/FixJ family response regulator